MEPTLLFLLLEYPLWVLLGLFGIILLESSVCPFLPGDTLLFAAGVTLRSSSISVHVAALLFLLATGLGVTVNYLIGWRLHKRIRNRGFWGITVEQLVRTEHLVETHGARLLIFGRFLPGIRVVVPLLAGSGRMAFGRFTVYNLVGGVSWIGLFVYSGYFFGALPAVRVYLVPIFVLLALMTLLPILIRWFRKAWRRSLPHTDHP